MAPAYPSPIPRGVAGRCRWPAAQTAFDAPNGQVHRICSLYLDGVGRGVRIELAKPSNDQGDTRTLRLEETRVSYCPTVIGVPEDGARDGGLHEWGSVSAETG